MQSEALKNFNDGVDYYQNIAHSAGIHLKPLTNPTRREIEDRMEKLEQAKSKTHDPQRVQKLNRLKNYLLEANYELQ